MYILTVVVAMVEFVAIFLVNDDVYANVMNLTLYIVVPLLCLIYGWVGVARGRAARAVLVNLVFMAAALILFMGTMPHVTYHEGQKLVLHHVRAKTVHFTAVPERTILVSHGFAFLLHPRFYYYAVVLPNATQPTHEYFTVNPVTGKVLKLKSAFYH